MSEFLNQWGGLIGLIGAILSLIGLAAALLAAYRAKKAEDAAEEASEATRSAITRSLTTVDLERAIALVQRLKELQQESRWTVSSALYQTLRVMLIDIEARYPANVPELQQQLHRAILQVTEIDNNVSMALSEGFEPPQPEAFTSKLNDIQVNLERMSSYIKLPTDDARN